MTRIEALKLCHAYMREQKTGPVYHQILKVIGGRDKYNAIPLPGLTRLTERYQDDPLELQTWIMKYLEPLITDEGNDADPSTNAGDR